MFINFNLALTLNTLSASLLSSELLSHFPHYNSPLPFKC